MDKDTEAHQELCRLLVCALLSQTVDRFSHDIEDYGGIITCSLVSGTRDACFSLSEVGVLTSETPGYYRPLMPSRQMDAWVKAHVFSRREQDVLLRGMCHMWSWFLSSNYAYDVEVSGMNEEMRRALEGAGFIEMQHDVPYWTKVTLPWLFESGLAGIDDINMGAQKDGAEILAAMPIARIQTYSKLAINDTRRVFCLLCANWDGSNWNDRGHNFICPNATWQMGAAKSALVYLRSSM